MRNSVDPEQLADVLAQQLGEYRKGVQERVNAAGLKAIKALVKKTKQNAPVGARFGHYRSSITYQVEEDRATGGKTYTWGVKGPDSRLTHLLAHGHATKDGGRTDADPFLHDALAAVLPVFESDVEEAVKGD